MWLGFRHPSPRRVLSGKRHLTLTSLAGICRALELNQAARHLGTDLVLLGRAKNNAERSFYSQRLVGSRRFQNAFPLRSSQARYLSKWYLPAIREMVGLPGFKDDPEWVAKRLEPEITSAQAKRALEDLIKTGFLKREKKGKLKQAHGVLDTGDELLSPLVRDYHRSMARKGLEAVDRYEVEQRNLQGVTISLSEENRERLWEMISRFRQEVVSLVDQSKDPKSVYQVNFQLFPLAPKDKEPEEN
jgi:uncharacterized protein (TIGR02147 family)